MVNNVDPNNPNLWSVPNEWTGQRCFIIGGGPSFNPTLAPKLQGRVIAINEAYIERPDADVLYWADPQWAIRQGSKIKLHRGKYRVSRRWAPACAGPDVKQIGWTPPFSNEGLRPFSVDPHYVGGYCSGGNAINLAFLFGANPIYLLGFDMRVVDGKKNYHDRYTTRNSARFDFYVRNIEFMAPVLKNYEREVLNCSPNSALKCFPYVPLEVVL